MSELDCRLEKTLERIISLEDRVALLEEYLENTMDVVEELKKQVKKEDR